MSENWALDAVCGTGRELEGAFVGALEENSSSSSSSSSSKRSSNFVEVPFVLLCARVASSALLWLFSFVSRSTGGASGRMVSSAPALASEDGEVACGMVVVNVFAVGDVAAYTALRFGVNGEVRRVRSEDATLQNAGVRAPGTFPLHSNDRVPTHLRSRLPPNIERNNNGHET